MALNAPAGRYVPRPGLLVEDGVHEGDPCRASSRLRLRRAGLEQVHEGMAYSLIQQRHIEVRERDALV